MSLILKGIDLPPKGKYYPLYVTDTGEVGYLIENVKVPIDDAQAIPIPMPHGRLIDEDRVAQIVLTLPSGESWSDTDMLSILDDAPTILEEEE